jgi:hypothetical protein
MSLHSYPHSCHRKLVVSEHKGGTSCRHQVMMSRPQMQSQKTEARYAEPRSSRHQYQHQQTAAGTLLPAMQSEDA